MNFFRFVLISAASGLAFNAQAYTFNWGVHDTFEVIEPVSLFNATESNNFDRILGIEDGMVTRYKEAGAVALNSFAFDDKSGAITYASGAQAVGDYSYLLASEGVGTRGGLYPVSSTVTPVSEPETYVLLSGLGVIGLLALRRRSGRYSS